MFNYGIVVLLCSLHMHIIKCTHFRGGMITWRPLNSTPSGSTVVIQIRQRYSWNRVSVPCTDTTISTLGLIGDSTSDICVSGTCPVWTAPTARTYCTDYSAIVGFSSGEKYDTRTINLNTAFSFGFDSGNWFGTLVVGANGLWKLITRVNTNPRPDGTLNSSPVTSTLPVIYKAINVQHVHVIQMADFDTGDVLKCRWATSGSNYNGYNECAGVCSGVPGAVLFSNNCTLVFTLVNAGLYAAVAVQIEDYYTSTATTPMSSIPLQFLFYGYTAPTGCSIPPTIIGVRPNRACIGTPIGANVTDYVIAEVGCPGKTIIEFVTNSPIGLRKSVIQNPSTGIYQIVLSWIPTAGQYGPQGFCAGAVDNTNVQSEQWCITYVVGFDSPDIIRPTVVQGSASPLGTILQNHTLFSIQTTKSVGRPTRNGTNIHFVDATNNTIVRTYDCGWHPDVFYLGITIVIVVNNPPWVPGRNYYVKFDSGVASGTEFCGPESAPITSPSFWAFNIWDPGLSSTTTTTISTTAPTVGTVTTRAASTTTPSMNLTTTGIIVTSATTPNITLTTTTTSTSTSTTTATTGTPPTTTSTIGVVYPKDLETACAQPVAIMTAVSSVTVSLIHAAGMFAAFSKFSNMFNPSKIQAQMRQNQRMNKVFS